MIFFCQQETRIALGGHDFLSISTRNQEFANRAQQSPFQQSLVPIGQVVLEKIIKI
jgi:hypothetical protein